MSDTQETGFSEFANLYKQSIEKIEEDRVKALIFIESLVCECHNVRPVSLYSSRTDVNSVNARYDFVQMANALEFSHEVMAAYLRKSVQTIRRIVNSGCKSPDLEKLGLKILAKDITLKQSPSTHVLEHKE